MGVRSTFWWRVVAVLLTAATLALSLWAWSPLQSWVLTKRRYCTGDASGWARLSLLPTASKAGLRGWVRTPRWSAKLLTGTHVIKTMWYPESGFIAEVVTFDGEALYVTAWSVDGTVLAQEVATPGAADRTHRAPPWLWGAGDQQQPTIPEWMRSDELWREAVEASR